MTVKLTSGLAASPAFTTIGWTPKGASSGGSRQRMHSLRPDGASRHKREREPHRDILQRLDAAMVGAAGLEPATLSLEG